MRKNNKVRKSSIGAKLRVIRKHKNIKAMLNDSGDGA